MDAAVPSPAVLHLWQIPQSSVLNIKHTNPISQSVPNVLLFTTVPYETQRIQPQPRIISFDPPAPMTYLPRQQASANCMSIVVASNNFDR
jgi:hypothetical protein